MATASLLFQKIEDSLEGGLPFVAYKKAHQQTLKAVFQGDDQLHLATDFSEQGFVFAPFDADASPVLMPFDEILEVPFGAEESRTFQHQKNLRNFEEARPEKKRHMAFVEATKNFLKEAAVSKVVIARSKEVHCPKFDPILIFQRLLRKYPEATAYVWFHPKVGLWMGATPELLLKTQEKHFYTMSLAGTQMFRKDATPVWGEKELEEQKMVTEELVSKLAKTVNQCVVSEVQTVRAGHLLHLKTDISGTLGIENKLSQLISALHPTPAVCGYPRNKAKAYILANENFDRSYYTGFFGELNLHSQTSLYVNLRCFQKTNADSIKIYAGGGITSKSDAEKEWEETVSKCATVEAVL